MRKESPEDSKIKVKQGVHSTRYIWKEGRKTIAHYATSLFLLLWFCGWTMGGGIAIKKFFEVSVGFFVGKFPVSVPLFFITWLGMWTIGEIVVFMILYLALRPQKPALLTLSEGRIFFETGTRFPALDKPKAHRECRSIRGYNNRSYDLKAGEAGNLKLERIGENRRLSFDCGAERVEIGRSLTEPEKEWLYGIMLEHAPKLTVNEYPKWLPPVGSKIQVKETTHSKSFVWKNAGCRINLATLFLIFWLAGWTIMGIVSPSIGTGTGQDGSSFGGGFRFWLIAEIVAVVILYLSLRPQKPSILTLSKGKISFETGTSPSIFAYDRQKSTKPFSSMKKLRNKAYEVELSQLSNLRLDRVGERQCLFFEYEDERVEIGDTLSEPEREWLYEILRGHR
jgi:hypothetical protein